MLECDVRYCNRSAGDDEGGPGPAAAVEHGLAEDAGDARARVDEDAGLGKRVVGKEQRGGLPGVDGVGDGFARKRDAAERCVGASGRAYGY